MPPDPFALLQQGQENTAALFSGIQRATIQTRQLQLQEQNQIFQQGLDLRKLDIMEKQNAFNQIMALANLGMKEQEMGFRDRVTAAQARAYDALADQRLSKIAEDQAGEFVTSQIPFPINGTPEEVIQWSNRVGVAKTAQLNSWGMPAREQYMTPSGEVDAEAVTDDVMNDMTLPEDEGSDASPSLFSNTQRMIGGLPPRLSFEQAAKVTTQEAKAQTAPVSTFEQFQKATTEYMRMVTTSPNIKTTDRQMLLKGINSTLMMGTMRMMNTDPKAMAYMNELAPERDAVYSAALRGDEDSVRSYIRENQDRIGFPNPILESYAQRGYEEKARLDQIQLRRDNLSKNLRLVKEYTDAGEEVPGWLKEEISDFKPSTDPAEIKNQADLDRPRR